MNSKYEALVIAGKMFVRETKEDGSVIETEVCPADTVEKRLAEMKASTASSETKETETANAATEPEAKKESIGDKLKKPVLIGLGLAGAVLLGKKYGRKSDTTASATEASTDVVETPTVESTMDEVP